MIGAFSFQIHPIPPSSPLLLSAPLYEGVLRLLFGPDWSQDPRMTAPIASPIALYLSRGSPHAPPTARLSFLSTRIGDFLMDRIQSAPDGALRDPTVPFTLSPVHLPSLSSFRDLLSCPTIPESLTFRFLSPVLLWPFPSPDLIFPFLLKKWNRFAPKDCRTDFPPDAFRHILISRHRLSGKPYPFRRSIKHGFTGTASFLLRRLPTDLRSRLFSLASFSEFSGIGPATFSGFGSARLLFPTNP